MAAKKVLYAEDEFTSRKILETQLLREGILCDTADDGLAAVEKFKEGSYDLVILDRYMPGMNGDEAAKIIGSLAPGIPLIAVTSDASDTEVLHSAGFRHIFIKPLRGREHIAIIETYLSLAQGGGS